MAEAWWVMRGTGVQCQRFCPVRRLKRPCVPFKITLRAERTAAFCLFVLFSHFAGGGAGHKIDRRLSRGSQQKYRQKQ